MKTFIAIATLAIVAVVSAAPTVPNDKEQVMAYAQSVLKFGQDLLKEFPQNKAIQQIVERIAQQIQELKVYNMNHIVDTIINFAAYKEKLDQMAQSLRHPNAEDNNRTKILSFAKSNLKFTEDLLKHHRNAPEAIELSDIIADFRSQIKTIESEGKPLKDIVKTIVQLVETYERLGEIEDKLHDH